MAMPEDAGKTRREIIALVIAGISLVVAGAGAVVAYLGWTHANEVDDQRKMDAKKQARFERQVEERQSAPLLAPGVEPSMKTRRGVAIASSSGDFAKPVAADLLWGDGTQLVVPVRNVGAGLASLNGSQPVFLRNCGKEPRSLDPRRKPSRGGYYNIPPGESFQLLYHLRPKPERQSDQSAKEYQQARKSWERRDGHYRTVAKQGGIEHLLISYTDLLGRRWRWSCFDYTRPNGRVRWSLRSATYGTWESR